MSRIEKTVFISYRRTNFPWAYCIYQDLTHNGYDVFFDYQSIDSGSFEKILLENIRARAHFIIILSPSALEKCNQPGDWLRREIETAMDEGRNIIPVMLEGFDFGSPLVKKALTGKLSFLSSINGMSLVAEYVEAGFEKLRNRFLNVALEDVHLHTLAEEAKVITETQKLAANAAPPVEREELTSQEWFERGYVFDENQNYDEAIRCFTEAIRLDPKNANAFAYRGNSRREKDDLTGAIEDLDKAIQLEPEQRGYYGFRGFARKEIGDLQGAIEDYSESIRIKPDNPSVFTLRGLAYIDNGELGNALKDFDIAINYDPDRSLRYFYRGGVWEKKRNYSKAIADYQKYLELGAELEWVTKKELKDTIKKLKKRISKKKQVKKK